MGAHTQFGLGPVVDFEITENGGKFKALDITKLFLKTVHLKILMCPLFRYATDSQLR